jgi:hypothetical protein
VRIFVEAVRRPVLGRWKADALQSSLDWAGARELGDWGGKGFLRVIWFFALKDVADLSFKPKNLPAPTVMDDELPLTL